MKETLGTAPEQALTKAIIKSHLHLGLGADRWFAMLVDDCMASMGKKLETPWTDDETEHLYKLGKLYGQAVGEAPFRDLLGHAYQELATNFGRKGLGQYFTPSHLAQVMAKLTFNSDLFETQEVVRFSEPTAGSGVMVLAFMEAIMENDPAFLGKTSFTCVDLEFLCVKMTTLQLLANNLYHARNLGEIKTLHGNSLGLQADLELYLHASTPTYDELAKKQHERETAEAIEKEKLKLEAPKDTPKDTEKEPRPDLNQAKQVDLF